MRLLAFSILAAACAPASSDKAPTWNGARAIHLRDGAYASDAPATATRTTFVGGRANVTDARTGVALMDVGLDAWGRRADMHTTAGMRPGWGPCAGGSDTTGECIRRLDFSTDQITAWWVAVDTGFEQGWTIPAPVAGDGPLLLAVTVHNAGVEAAVGGAVLVDAGGHRWTVSAPSARDAKGDAVGVALDTTSTSLTFVVDDATAEYPISVDPLYTTAATTLLGGSGEFGYVVAAVGDLDGDSHSDFAVQSRAVGALTGRVNTYLSLGGSGTAFDEGPWYDGAAVGDEFGSAIAGGDVNGDGFSDLVVSADEYGDETGRVYLYLGSEDGPEPSPVATWTGGKIQRIGASLAVVDTNGDGYDEMIVGRAASYGAYVYDGSEDGPGAVLDSSLDETTWTFGEAMAKVGDVNGDGYQDLAVAAPRYDSGRVFIFDGSVSGLTTTADVTLTGEDTNSSFGEAIASIGDADGDGYDDVVVGASGYNSYAGRAYVFPGSASGLGPYASTTLQGSTSGIYFGHAVAGGDIDHDGFGDVVVGAYHAGHGALYVYPGSSVGIPTTASKTVSASGSDDALGWSLAMTDIGGDGYDDVISGDFGYNDGGGVRLYAGTSAGLSTTSSVTAPLPSQDFGSSIGALGDVNGDGFDDLILGATGFDGYRGSALLYRGNRTGVSTTAELTETGSVSAGWFGYRIASAGDIDGDGLGDVIVGAYKANKAYVYYGDDTEFLEPAFTTLTGPSSSSDFGHGVASAGDVNADGYDDVIVGAPAYSTSTGRAYIYLGGAFGIATSPTTTLTGSTTYSDFGSDVDGAGDVDGDGFDDVIVGAYGHTANTGRVYIYRGGTAGTSTSAATTLAGSAPDDAFGKSVAGAGDVDADGYADVIVGASGADSAYIFRGSATGVPTTPSLTLTVADAGFGWVVDGDFDIDTDGFSDVVVGAPGYDFSNGRVYVYVGSASGIGSSPESTIDGTSSLEHVGIEVAALGDVNGDGYDDLAIGTDDEAVRIFLGGRDDDGDGLSSVVDCDDDDATVGGPSTSLYRDYDDDGYGTLPSVLVCEGTDGYVLDHSDCDDDDAATNPSASEIVGDEIDSNCDGGEQCYVDADGDLFRTASVAASSDLDCADAGEATAAVTPGDCDDTNATVHPGASEIAGDETDQDCDGKETCYSDGDGDGYRTTAVVASADADCTDAGEANDLVPTGDCSDVDAAINPAATENADDGIDSNCDGVERCFTDADDDGYTIDASTTTDSLDLDCTDSGEGRSTDPTGDCNDTSKTVHPGAIETPADGQDADCNGGELCYEDVDFDTYRATATVASTDMDCADPGEATGAALSDCDDTDASIHPAAAETLDDGIDYDCDGKELCLTDADSDGYALDGTTTTLSVDLDCNDPGEASTVDPVGDCDDNAGTIYPGAPETIDDGVDADCNGGELCYTDDDGDGFRATDTIASADMDCVDGTEAGAIVPSGDCDDANAAVGPSATEGIGDEIDQDCDGGEICYTDADSDGYRASDLSVTESPDTRCDAPGEALATAMPTDCDDHAADVNPEGVERCNGADDDCDGAVDGPGSVDAQTWEADGDDDGYTDRDDTVVECAPPPGYRVPSAAEDCDDDDGSVHPGASEIVDDAIDQDCDGADETTPSTDDSGGDGVGDDGVPTGDGDAESEHDDQARGCSHTSSRATVVSALVAILALCRRRGRRPPVTVELGK